jgi:hypothetical protein
MPSSTTTTTSSFTPEKIRQDWIDAVFGTDFFPLPTASNVVASTPTPVYQPPRQGSGLAHIPSFVTYSAEIPPPPLPGFSNMSLEQAREPKLGMTLSKLALGLYVTHVDPESEAAYAGVLPGSILVELNGMGMLAEPSRHALERLWQYEGLFHSHHGNDNAQQHPAATNDEASASSRGSSDSHRSSQQQPTTTTQQYYRPKMQDPLALTFIKDGTMYTVLLVANPPYGIQWASCGNFCLVNRSYSYASSIGGVRRGSLVANVNGHSLREMDHLQFGDLLRQLFQSRQTTIHLWLCYTPAAARTGYFERLMAAASEGKMIGDHHPTESTTPITTTPKTKASRTQKANGVEIRIHSLEESWQSLWWGEGSPCSGDGSTQGSLSKAFQNVLGRGRSGLLHKTKQQLFFW